MDLQSSFERDRDFSTSARIKSEIRKQDSSLRNIHEIRLRLALRLEENLALQRAISFRDRQPLRLGERSRSLRLSGRMR
jgi:hypothetical protein